MLDRIKMINTGNITAVSELPLSLWTLTLAFNSKHSSADPLAWLWALDGWTCFPWRTACELRWVRSACNNQSVLILTQTLLPSAMLVSSIAWSSEPHHIHTSALVVEYSHWLSTDSPTLLCVFLSRNDKIKHLFLTSFYLGSETKCPVLSLCFTLFQTITGGPKKPQRKNSKQSRKLQ